MSTTRSVSMKAEATGPATLEPSSNRPDYCCLRYEAASSGGLTWDLWRGAQAGPWVSAIKTATTGAPAVEQPAHYGVARPAKRIEAAGHSIDRRIILSRSGKTERASPCRGISLPDRRPGEQQESRRRNRERDLTHVSLLLYWSWTPFPHWNAGSDATAYFSTILRRRHAPHFGRGVMTAVTLAAPWLNYFDPKCQCSVGLDSGQNEIVRQAWLRRLPLQFDRQYEVVFSAQNLLQVAVGTLIVKTSAGP